MPLRVGLDMDGVLADFRSAFEREAHRPTGVLSPDGDQGDVDGLSNQEIKRIWSGIQSTPNWWTRVAAYEPGEIVRLYELARRARWEVVFMTKRPVTAGEPIQFQTQHWLERHGFFYPAVVTVPGSRGELANALKLDIIVDDQLYNCVDVVTGSHSKALLLLRDADPKLESQAVARGIGVVRTLEEAIDALHGMERTQAESKGRLQRLSDWLQPRRGESLPTTPGRDRGPVRPADDDRRRDSE